MRKSDKPRAMASWESRVCPAGSPDPPASDRAAGVLGEVLKAAKGIDPAYRATVSKRRIMVSRPQRRFLGAGLAFCAQLLSELGFDSQAMEERSQLPATGSWIFDVSCGGPCVRSRKSRVIRIRRIFDPRFERRRIPRRRFVARSRWLPSL